MDFETLPCGSRFAFWEDSTRYGKVYHVAQRHPKASDGNPGTGEAPFLTVGAAARVLQGGQKVIVHEGVYRECVRPPRGGDGPDKMIAYEAAGGERVVIKGSEVWTPRCRPSAGYRIPAAGGATVWMADLPEEFLGGYNPFLLRNAYQYLPVYSDLKSPEFIMRAMLRRGSVFVDGLPLRQVYYSRQLADGDGAFWVEEPGLRLHFRLPGDADPAEHSIEVTVREQIFAPREFHLGYIRLSGFVFEHAADGLPVPQRAAVSTTRGHHWIIENCRVEWANACGMDIGAQTWHAEIPDPTGRHVIRGNTIRNCGVCGLAGAMGVHHTLIEDNTIERIGGLNVERMWECAGVKFHLAEHCLIRRNVLRHITNAGGIWLDCSNVDNRVSGNVFADIETLTGAMFSEMNYDANLVDHNVFWDIRGADPSTGRIPAVRADCNEKLVVAHNFFGKVRDYAVSFSLIQSDRKHDGRTGLCRANVAINNVFHQCPNRIHLGRREANRSDGNLFDAADDSCSFNIAHPEPGCHQDLAGWREFFGLDLHSTQARIEASFDPETCKLQWKADGPMPVCEPDEALPAEAQSPAPGPASDGQ